MNTQLHRTVLIVEDSPEDRELYRRYLLRDQDYDYTIVEASLGEEGLNLWRQHQPDAVLLDYRLPDLDGLEFLAALQTQQPLPIVMVTGAGSETIAVQSIKAGAQDYLVKEQITPEGLKLALETTIKTVQLQTQLQERIDRERVVTQIAQKVFRSLDLNEILQTTVTEVRQFLQTDRVVVFQVEPDGDGRVVAESVGAEWRSILAEQIHDPCFVESYVTLQRQGRVTVKADIHDGSIDPCNVQLLAGLQVRANLVVPILHDDQFWGVLIAHHCAAPRQWHPLEIDLLQQLSTQVSVAIRQAELYQQSQHELAERKRTEEVLRGSEERLRLGLQAARMGTWDWNILENRIIWSSNMEALFGLAPGEFDGSYEQFVARLHPDDRDRVLDAINAAIATGANYDIEFRVLYPDGTIRWALSQGKVFYDASEQPIRMSGVDLDISDRKIAEAALLESEERFRSTFEQAAVGIAHIGLNGGWLTFNHKVCDIVGYMEVELLDLTFQDITNPEDLAIDLEYVRQLLAGERQTYTMEKRYIHKLGHIVWVNLTVSLRLNAAGAPLHFISVIEAIDERKRIEEALQESETRFRQLAENIDAVFWLREEPEGRASYVSSAYERLWGWQPQELYENHSFWVDHIHPDDREWASQAFQSKAAAGQFDEEYRIVLDDGTIRWVNDRCFPLYDQSGTLYRFAGIAEDITDRKRSEIEIHRSESQLRRVLDSLFSFVGVMTPDGTLIEANRTALAAASLSATDVLEKPFPDAYWWAYDPEIQAQLWAAIRQAAAGETVRYDVQIRLGEDQFIIIDFCLAPLLYDSGEVEFLIPSGIDITDRIRAKEALQQSEEFKNSVLESSSDCIKVLDLDAQLLYMNAGGICLLEIDDLTPYLNSEWLCFWQGEHRQAAKAAFTAAKSGEIRKFQGFCATVKGKPKWWDVVVTPIRDSAGQVVKILSTSRDVTERKRTEAELQQKNAILDVINESAPTPIFVKDRQGRIIYANPATLAALGKTAAEVIGRYDSDLYPSPEDAVRVMENDQRIMASGQVEVVEETPDGIHIFLGMKAPYYNEAGEVIGLIGISNDITDRVQLERDRERILQQKQAALVESERVNRIKDEFLAILSHELRSPLNPILGWTKLLQTRKLDETKTIVALETIERNAKAQCQLIDDLLDMARVLRGKMSLNMAPVNLLKVIESAIDTVQTAAIAKSIQIHPMIFDVGQVAGDDVRLQQIVWNLLTNAVKFTPNSGHIDIRLEQLDNQAQITITDTGKGISPDFLPHIFESFCQEDASVTRNHGGLGLGMAIVYQLVEAHGGTVTADSPGEGKGATFTVSLPLLNVNSKEDQSSPSPEQNLDLTGIRVLTIDDDPDCRELLSLIVAQAGAEVMCVTSAAEFLTALESFQPDVVVSDIGMPEIDGYTLLRQVRLLSSQGGQVPAIALTAYAGEIDRQQAIAAGFQKHIAKPIEPDQLVAAIVSLLNGRSLS